MKMLGNLIRRRLAKSLAGHAELRLDDTIPSREELARKFETLDEFGIYLHIPFCRQICPYCPYNKELYESEIAGQYVTAVKQEIDSYAGMVGQPTCHIFVHWRGHSDHHAPPWLEGYAGSHPQCL